MPRKPPSHRPPGTPTLAERRREYDQRRDPADRRFYASAAWQRFRVWFLAAHPVCEDCERAPAVEVHHQKKRKQFPELAFEEDNCQGLCHSCHSRRTAKGE